MTQPTLYIIAGCNGAGKTTASYSVLPQLLGCKEFVNADEIAKGLSPFNPESVAFEAGRIMLQRINTLISERKTFALETTLSTRSYKRLLNEIRNDGYHIVLLFFWLASPEIAKDRVKSRVLAGGHNIPEDIITRRYYRGLKNLFQLYLPIVNEWMIFDNNMATALIAEKSTDSAPTILNERVYNILNEQANNG